MEHHEQKTPAAGFNFLPPNQETPSDEVGAEGVGLLEKPPGYEQSYVPPPIGYQQGPPNMGYQQGPLAYGQTYVQAPVGYQQGSMGYGQQAYGQQLNPPGQHGHYPTVAAGGYQPYPVPADCIHRYRSYNAQIGFSCFVFWCCFWPLGLAAFILAMRAKDSQSLGLYEKAMNLGKASWRVSIVGVIVGIIFFAVLISINQ